MCNESGNQNSSQRQGQWGGLSSCQCLRAKGDQWLSPYIQPLLPQCLHQPQLSGFSRALEQHNRHGERAAQLSQQCWWVRGPRGQSEVRRKLPMNIREWSERDLPGGPVVKESPCNAGDTGSIPGPGPKTPRAARQLSPQTTTREPARCNYWAHTHLESPWNKRSRVRQWQSHVYKTLSVGLACNIDGIPRIVEMDCSCNTPRLLFLTGCQKEATTAEKES